MLFLKIPVPSLLSRVDFLGLALLDVLLIFGNFLQFKIWKKNIYHLLIYALAVQVGLCTYVFTKQISLLIPGFAFLGFSILALEMGRLIPGYLKSSEEVKQLIRESMTHVGLAFLIGFLSRFVTVHLQIDPIWNGISLRWLTEALGLFTLVYWMVFYPRKTDFSIFTRYVGNRLVEGCLGFITLFVVAEMPEVWRPLIWVIMASGLLLGSLSDKWPQRLFAYSWIYFIASIVHVAFVTSTLTMPSLFIIERFYFPAFIAIALQFGYASLVHIKLGKIEEKMSASSPQQVIQFISSIYHFSTLTVLWPVFIGIALVFAFNFEKTLLTLLWVGLISAFYTENINIESRLMKGFRIVFFLLLVLGIASVLVVLIKEQIQPPFSRTLASFFLEVGKPIKSVDRAISRIFLIDEIDEKMLGEEIKLKFAALTTSYSKEEEATVRYLNSLIDFSTKESSKPFEYQVFLIEGSPNACAFPGGVICVTKGLMSLLENEAELLAILGHESGHIERGHLFDAARGEMLRRKIQASSVPVYAAEVIQMILGSTFSKTQEDEADEYGFRMLLKKGYDLFALSTSFEKIKEGISFNQKLTDPFNDFFSTHPSIELRIEKFRFRAKRWKGHYPHKKKYIGKKNFANRTTSFEVNYPDEWDES